MITTIIMYTGLQSIKHIQYFE